MSSEEVLHEDHEAMVRVLRDVVRQENGLKRWAMSVAGIVAATGIIGGVLVWRTQAVVVDRLERVETHVAKIDGTLTEIRDRVIEHTSHD